MPVHKDPSGRRSVQAEVEVPGTPEEVWQAIVTGPGISSWFVPTQVEEREGGTVTANFGPGMDSASTITLWDPPRRFVAESQDLGPNAPSIATEWIVEARSGGRCVVRVVHSLFASADDWDGQLEGFEGGWPAFFRILRLYLAHFRGQPCTAFQTMGVAPEPTAQAWDALTGPLALTAAPEGQRVSTPTGAPPLAGLVERRGPPEYPELLLRLDQPAAGIAHLFALPMGGQVYLPLRVFLYGDQAPAAAVRAEPLWQAWMAERFPLVAEGAQTG
ncbi:MAG TPA: SRPBCC domain-containing protein [Chloroflexota bacterium]|nr:SRPBCC domain-containing protein [Chloroflexota bacterium]